MPQLYSIRPIGEQDRDDWETLWQGYNAFYGRQGDTALSAEVVDATWCRLLDPSEPVSGLVAGAENRLVGLAHFIFHRNTIHIEDTCYLQDLFTLPEWRGCGIARQLVETVYEICRARDVTSVYWHTHSSNTMARQLYDRIARNTDFLVYRAKL